MSATPARIVICPDSFKGSATAVAIASALAQGWSDKRPDDHIELIPMADGGEGTRRAFHAARPDIRVVELAELCGIETLPTLDPWGAGTRPFGEALRQAILAAAKEQAADATVYVGIGSSASTDCGAGMLQGLGFALLDASGATVSSGLQGVERVASIETAEAAAVLDALQHVRVNVITDVTAPLLGTTGAVQAFGPQKGLPAADFPRAERSIKRFATLLAQHLPHPVSLDHPGAGAAGGVGFALSCLGAQLLPGAQHVATALRLEEAIAKADLVISGEGAFDATSLQGKVPATVLALCSKHGVDCALVAGTVKREADISAFVQVRSLSELAGDVQRSIRNPLPWCEQAGSELAQWFSA